VGVGVCVFVCGSSDGGGGRRAGRRLTATGVGTGRRENRRGSGKTDEEACQRGGLSREHARPLKSLPKPVHNPNAGCHHARTPAQHGGQRTALSASVTGPASCLKVRPMREVVVVTTVTSSSRTSGYTSRAIRSVLVALACTCGERGNGGEWDVGRMG